MAIGSWHVVLNKHNDKHHSKKVTHPVMCEFWLYGTLKTKVWILQDLLPCLVTHSYKVPLQTELCADGLWTDSYGYRVWDGFPGDILDTPFLSQGNHPSHLRFHPFPTLKCAPQSPSPLSGASQASCPSAWTGQVKALSLFFFFSPKFAYKAEPYIASEYKTVHEELTKSMTTILKPSADFLTSNKLLKVTWG